MFKEKLVELILIGDETVAKDTVLGEETTENRKRGRTVEDVATAVSEGLRENKRQRDHRD